MEILLLSAEILITLLKEEAEEAAEIQLQDRLVLLKAILQEMAVAVAEVKVE